jgi:hypothetical protein
MKLSSSRLSVERGRIDNAVLKNYGETAVIASTGPISTYTIDLTQGNTYYLTLNTNVTFTFSNVAASTSAVSFDLFLKQDAIGSRTVTWPAAVIWPGGSAPTLTTKPYNTDIFSFLSEDGGTTWRGFQPQKNFQLSANPLFAWGDNSSGQLGFNDGVTRSSPVQVGTLATWASVAAATNASSAIDTAGKLWAWGDNSSGRLGLGDTVKRSSPVQVGTLATWASVAAAFNVALAIDTAGKLWAWGDNSSGRLGLGDTVKRSSPVQVGTLATWASVAATNNNTALAIDTAGKLWAWGDNSSGQLGFNDGVTRSSPVQVGTLATWASVAAATNASSAIDTAGKLWAWGDNSSGRLGLGDTVTRSSPVQVGALNAWSSPTQGDTHSLAIRSY